MQTNSAVQGFGSIPSDLSLEELFDLIMGNIEPDLTSKNLPTLDEKYTNETPEEKKARGERYAEAFVLFEETFIAMTNAWEEGVSAYRAEALITTKQTSAEDDSRRLDDLGGAMNAA